MISILKDNQIIKVRVNATTFDYYKNKGYDVKMNHSIEAKAEDLSHSSDKEIIVICDYCNKEFSKQYKNYLSSRKYVQKDACFDCFPLKQKDVIQYKYSVDSTLQLENLKRKVDKLVKLSMGLIILCKILKYIISLKKL